MTAIDQAVQSNYANLEWAMNIPDVGNILRQAAAEHWDQARIEGAISQTAWWKSTSAASRQWQEVQANDPATATATRASLMTSAQDLAQNYEASGLDLNNIVDTVLKTGGSSSDLAAMIRSQSGYYARQKGEQTAARASGLYSTVETLAQDYAIPMDANTIWKWAVYATGGRGIGAVEDYMKEQAKSRFPSLGGAIDQGVTVKQYVAPYIQDAVSELGINPAEFNLQQAKWSHPLEQVDPTTGNKVPMSRMQWIRTLRTDPMYGYDTTTQGVDQAAQLTTQLANKFGAI